MFLGVGDDNYAFCILYKRFLHPSYNIKLIYRDFDRRRSIGKHDQPQELKQLVLELNLSLVAGDGDGLMKGDHVLAQVGVKLFVATLGTMVADGDEAGAQVVYWTWPKDEKCPFIEQDVEHFHPFSNMLCKLDPPTDISESRRRPKWVFPCLQQPNSAKVLDWLLERYD